jgi:monoamine oxidase
MITIIGAGLSGLLTAYRLEKAGIPYRVLEARDRIGGRIHTVLAKNETPVEMGATWFQSAHTNLKALLDELEIEYFEQNMEGIAFYQPDLSNPAQPVRLPEQQPSYRVTGGTSTLIDELYSRLNKEQVFLNQPVQKISVQNDFIEIEANDKFQTDKLIFCIPPKLLAEKIVFEPALPKELFEIAQQTHTWMEDSIKVAVIYEKPFWRKQQFSGTIFSSYGPMTELYDHGNFEDDKSALCGFLHPSYTSISQEERKSHILNQIANSFGAEAKQPIDYQETIWKQEEFTSNSTNNPLYPHQNNGHPVFRNSLFADKVFFSNSETASSFGGYMEGAVISAELVARTVISFQ